MVKVIIKVIVDANASTGRVIYPDSENTTWCRFTVVGSDDGLVVCYDGTVYVRPRFKLLDEQIINVVKEMLLASLAGLEVKEREFIAVLPQR
jgi:hypothetical protein